MRRVPSVSLGGTLELMNAEAVGLVLAERAHQNGGGAAWSVLVLAEGGTPDRSYFK